MTSIIDKPPAVGDTWEHRRTHRQVQVIAVPPADTAGARVAIEGPTKRGTRTTRVLLWRFVADYRLVSRAPTAPAEPAPVAPVAPDGAATVPGLRGV